VSDIYGLKVSKDIFIIKNMLYKFILF